MAVGFYDVLRGQPRALDVGTVEDVRNDELMVIAVGRACCDPNDVCKPYFRGQEGQVRVALTMDGVRRAWDELVKYSVAANVTRSRASDAELRALGKILSRGGVVLSDDARMLAGFLIEELGVEPEEADGDEDEPDVVVYRVEPRATP